MLANAIAAIIWLGISAYGVFGGADFGGGAWDLLAGGPKKGERPRALIERAIGPVWEANHVWLIFVLVYLWTAFPLPFVSIATTMWIPLTLAALGIIVRGSGFAFRKWAASVGGRRLYGGGFAGASIATPFFLGTVVGGVASGRVPLGNAAGDPLTSWLNPTSVLGGVMAVVACSHLAATLLAREAQLDSDADMEEYFRTRASWSGMGAGLVAVIGIGVLYFDAPSLFEGLTALRGVVLLLASAVGGVVSLWALSQRRFGVARPAAALAVVSVLWGWGAGQYPWILEDQASIADYAASDAVLWSLVVAFGVAAATAVPSLIWLLRLTQSRLLVDDAPHPDSTAALLGRMGKG